MLPFQIRIINGSEVSNLLTKIKTLFNVEFQVIVSNQHDNKMNVDLSNGELNFLDSRMEGAVTEKDLFSLKNNTGCRTDR